MLSISGFLSLYTTDKYNVKCNNKLIHKYIDIMIHDVDKINYNVDHFCMNRSPFNKVNNLNNIKARMKMAALFPKRMRK